MNLAQKIVEVRKSVEYLQKDTTGYKYKYVSGTSVLSKIRPVMDKLGLILKTQITETEWNESKVYIKMVMEWLDSETPEEKSITNWASAGMDDDPAKALGKALTYGERYYLLKFFNIPTDEIDPDKFQDEKPKYVPPKENADYKPELNTILEEIMLVAESNGWKRDNVEKFARTLGYGSEKAGWNILPQDKGTFMEMFSKDKKQYDLEKEEMDGAK